MLAVRSGDALLRLAGQVGGTLRRRFDLTVQHRGVRLTAAGPHRDAQLEELLTGQLADLQPLASLHQLGELPDQLGGQFDVARQDGRFGVLGRLGVPERKAGGFHQT